LQYSEGLIGPIVIHGPTSADWDVDLGAVLLQDWYHTPVFELWFQERQQPPVPANTALINGKNRNGSLGEYAQFSFIPGKKYRMRIINTSTDQYFKFSIDEHVMTVQAADFVPVEPYTQTVLSIALGQRYDIIFEANQNAGNYWMRAVPATSCSATLNPDGARAIVRYDGANHEDPTSVPYTPTMECVDEHQLVPVVHIDPGNFAFGEKVDISVIVDNYVKFTVNGSSMFIDWSEPTLLLADNHDSRYPAGYNVVSLNGTKDTV
jgi:FtsP/CotA-like multicopper oxidase with cupredoxin domain